MFLHILCIMYKKLWLYIKLHILFIRFIKQMGFKQSQVPVGFMVYNHSKWHIFQNFVNGINLTIILHVIRSWVFMAKTQLSTQLIHHLIMGMGSMVKSETPSCGFVRVWLKGAENTSEHRENCCALLSSKCTSKSIIKF